MAKTHSFLGLNDLTYVMTRRREKVNLHVNPSNCLVLVHEETSPNEDLEMRTFRTTWIKEDADREPRENERFIDIDFLKNGEEYAVFEVLKGS
jgi:hypothetical protein